MSSYLDEYRIPILSSLTKETCRYTFGLVKSAAIARGHAFAIHDHILAAGFSIPVTKVVMPSRELAEALYAEHVGKDYFENLMQSVMGEHGVNAFLITKENPSTKDYDQIGAWRAVMGATNSREASPDTIRGKFGGHLFDENAPLADNAVHGSDSIDSFFRETKLFFPELYPNTAAAEKVSL